jgi:hypothetical protein
MIGFVAPYTFTQFGTTCNYSAIAILYSFQLTVAHALGFSVLTSRILATDLSQSHCNLKSHVKSSCHSLIPSLPFLLNQLRLPSPELDPILDYCSVLHCTPSRLLTVPSYNSSARTPQKTPSTIISNACLLVRYLATDDLLLSAYASQTCVYRPVA